MSGGSAANTAVGIAELGGGGLSGRVHDDPLGHAFCDDIKNASVAFNNPPHVNGSPTASSIILITPDAIRSMNTYLGACIEFQPEDILRQMRLQRKSSILRAIFLMRQPARQLCQSRCPCC